MTILAEHFTSPGAYAIDLSFEETQKQLQIPKKILQDIVDKYYVPKKTNTKQNTNYNPNNSNRGLKEKI